MPGRGAMGAAGSCATSPRTGFDGDIVLEINTRKCGDPRGARGRPAGVAGVRPRALRGRDAVSDRAGPPRAGGPARRTPGPRSSRPPATLVRRAGVPRYDDPRGRRGRRRRRRRWCTTTSAPRTTCSSPPSSCRSTRGRRSRRRSPAASTARASGCCGSSSSVWDDPATGRPARAGPRHARARRASELLREASCRLVLPAGRAALGIDRPELRMPLVASQVLGLILRPLRARARAARLDAAPTAWSRVRARRSSATSTGESRCPDPDLPPEPTSRTSRANNSTHDE